MGKRRCRQRAAKSPSLLFRRNADEIDNHRVVAHKTCIEAGDLFLVVCHKHNIGPAQHGISRPLHLEFISKIVINLRIGVKPVEAESVTGDRGAAFHIGFFSDPDIRRHRGGAHIERTIQSEKTFNHPKTNSLQRSKNAPVGFIVTGRNKPIALAGEKIQAALNKSDDRNILFPRRYCFDMSDSLSQNLTLEWPWRNRQPSNHGPFALKHNDCPIAATETMRRE